MIDEEQPLFRPEEDRADADALAGRICAAAAVAAQNSCALLELLGTFDATNAVRFWTDVKSLAHWLSWCCSMTLGVAREHVRVARALQQMPTVTAAFREGRLSYSKVREVTRVVEVVDEDRLCALALTATASQLAKMISAFRSADGVRIQQQSRRRLNWHEREDGMIEVRARLPKEEAAVLLAALDTARDQFAPAPAGAETTAAPLVGGYDGVDALLDVARGFMDTVPEDRSGEDRTLVVVHVDADLLAVSRATGDVPAGRSTALTPVAGAESQGNVCFVEGVGPIESATAQRMVCDASLLGAVVDGHRNVLALGRTRRLVSRAQRRALMVRDGMCQYPGCAQTRHLKAHHIVAWSAGGPTDLDNLVLLCQWHHTAVHEGGVTIRRKPSADLFGRLAVGNGWRFERATGDEVDTGFDDALLAQVLVADLRVGTKDLTRSTTSTIPGHGSSGQAGRARPSASTTAYRPCSR